MKKNTIIQFIVTGMFLFGATACTGNFEDYNKNPHEPDQNDMGVDWYLVRSLALNLQDLMMPEQENFSQYVDCLMAGAFSGYVADSNLGTGCLVVTQLIILQTIGKKFHSMIFIQSFILITSI